MTDHYREAERLVKLGAGLDPLAAAQVHATLAQIDRSRRPRRGDAVEAWIKAKRDEQNRDTLVGDLAWIELDCLLNDYRLRADCGVSLDAPAPVEGGHDEPAEREYPVLPARELIHLTESGVSHPIVSCPAWEGGRPVRVLAAIGDGPDRVSVRWQDVAANRSAVAMSVLRDQQVRLISGGGQ